MKLAARRTSTAIAAVATAGMSTLVFGAVPANAAPLDCGAGTPVSPGVCEQTFTTNGTFTVPADVSKLEALLVGRGGAGVAAQPGTAGYAAGGGGEVRVVDLTANAGPVAVTVATNVAPGAVSSIGVEAVRNGADGTVSSSGSAVGGSSGNGQPGAAGAAGGSGVANSYGGGGGASGPAAGPNGGAGTTVSDVAGNGSLFMGDPRCFGGGGAITFTNGGVSVNGVPGCGGGDETAPPANSGGGGGWVSATRNPGSDGIVVVRWTVGSVTLSFDSNGVGTAPASQTFPSGDAPSEPAEPTAAGYTFGGWFSDRELTTAADFSAPLTESRTFYAKWTRVLAATGSTADAAPLGLGLATLLAGAGLAVVAFRRRRKES